MELLEEDPDSKRIEIYRQMAQEELTEKRKGLQEKGLDKDDKDYLKNYLKNVSKKANAIKKTIHRANLHIYIQNLAPGKWGYTYLKEKY